MASTDTLDILRRVPILGLFEEDALRVIANVADIRRLGAGDVLFRQGDRSDGGYVVLSGRIEVGRRGGEEKVDLGPASLVGQVALFVRMQRPATAVAAEPSEVLRVSPTLMKRVLQEYPSAADGMSRALVDDLAAVAAGLTHVERLVASLEEEAE